MSSNALQTQTYWLPRPDSMGEAVKMAEFLCYSDLAPAHYKGKPADLLMAADYAHTVGLPLFSGLRAIYVVKGKAAITSEGMLAICAGKPDFVDIDESCTGSGDDMIATCTIVRGKRTPVRRTFSMADAKRAEVSQNNAMYRKWPQRMLLMRARAFALRDCYADALAGVGACAEELANVYDVNDPEAWAVVSAPPASAPDAEQPVRRGPGRPRKIRPEGEAPPPRRRAAAKVDEDTPQPRDPLPGQLPMPDAQQLEHRIRTATSLDELMSAGREAGALAEGPAKVMLRELYQDMADRHHAKAAAAAPPAPAAEGIEALRERQAGRSG